MMMRLAVLEKNIKNVEYMVEKGLEGSYWYPFDWDL